MVTFYNTLSISTPSVAEVANDITYEIVSEAMDLVLAYEPTFGFAACHVFLKDEQGRKQGEIDYTVANALRPNGGSQ